MITKFKFSFTYVLLLSLLTSCTNQIAGTNDETVYRGISVFHENRTPAVNISVKLFPVNDTSKIPSYKTTTNDKGQYDVITGDGLYNIMIGNDSLGAFQDSVQFKKSHTTLQDAQIFKTHTLRGFVSLQPGHDPQSVTVQIIGTDKYSNVDVNGAYTIKGMALGDYTRCFRSTLPGYTPTYHGLTINSDDSDTINDTTRMVYTGIPVVTAIQTKYDQVTGVVTVTWDTIAYFNFKEFVVYRDFTGFGELSTTLFGSAKSCVYYDTLNFLTIDYPDKMTYRVAVRNKKLETGETYNEGEVTIQRTPELSLPSDTAVEINKPYTLKARIENATGDLRYQWDIGNKGVFVTSSKPETTLVLNEIGGETECVLNVTVNNRINLKDTITLRSEVKWKKIADHQPNGTKVGTYAVTLKDKIVLLGYTDQYCAVSSNGTDWEKIDMEIPSNIGKPIIYNDKIYVSDNQGYLYWTDLLNGWSKSDVPVCSTLYTGNHALGPQQGSLVPPSLFVYNDYLCVQTNPFVKDEKIRMTMDLVNWDSSTIFSNNLQILSSYSDISRFVAFRYGNYETYYDCLFEKNEKSQAVLFPDRLWSVGTSIISYKGKIFTNISDGTLELYLLDETNNLWIPCSNKLNVTVYSMVTLNEKVFAITSEGIYSF